ncbi:MAG: hypothetical protein AAB486_00580 [Patescibacteria group bacterium]
MTDLLKHTRSELVAYEALRLVASVHELEVEDFEWAVFRDSGGSTSRERVFSGIARFLGWNFASRNKIEVALVGAYEKWTPDRVVIWPGQLARIEIGYRTGFSSDSGLTFLQQLQRIANTAEAAVDVVEDSLGLRPGRIFSTPRWHTIKGGEPRVIQQSSGYGVIIPLETREGLPQVARGEAGGFDRYIQHWSTDNYITVFVAETGKDQEPYEAWEMVVYYDHAHYAFAFNVIEWVKVTSLPHLSW